MHCPNCGVKAIHGLNYCKNCGTNLNHPTGPVEHKIKLSAGLLLPPMLISIVGLIGLFATIANVNVAPPFLVGIAAITGATVFGVVALFIWLLLRLTGYSQSASREREQSLPAPTYDRPQIPAAPFERPSVTEGTTRNFDPVYGNRGARDTGS